MAIRKCRCGNPTFYFNLGERLDFYNMNQAEFCSTELSSYIVFRSGGRGDSQAFLKPWRMCPTPTIPRTRNCSHEDDDCHLGAKRSSAQLSSIHGSHPSTTPAVPLQPVRTSYDLLDRMRNNRDCPPIKEDDVDKKDVYRK